MTLTPDLTAAAVAAPPGAHPGDATRPTPRILVFDSGLGGLSVLAELRRARPDASFLYLADNGGFPYGRLAEGDLVARVLVVLGHAMAAHHPDLVVIACNTASTLVLPHLRAQYHVPFVGTVPAIKPAAIASRTKHISVLATPGTVSRDYTLDLVRSFAADCRVTLVGSHLLAALAEAEMAGRPATDTAIRAEIMPCFVTSPAGRTDTIVLACTHYPLIRHRIVRLAPWPVAYIDPAPAIARRVVDLLGRGSADTSGDGAEHGAGTTGRLVFTAEREIDETLRRTLAARGMGEIVVEPMPRAA